MDVNFYKENGIDITRLSKDYLVFPHKRGDIPPKEDIEYLYIELNLFHTFVSNYFGVDQKTLTKWLRIYNIHKPNNLKRENINKTNMERFGVLHSFQSDVFKEKSKETIRNKYNVNCKQQIHINPNTIDILSNKEKLEKFIKDNDIVNCLHLSKVLNISESFSAKCVRNLNLMGLFDYSQSLPEHEIRDYVNKYFVTENNTKKYLDGKEIDIYIPDKNIGIEFNGDHWHSDKFNNNKRYHQNKSLMAESKGIFIYHIFEYEWNTKREQIINQLNNLLGINTTKIYARKCDIKEVSNIEKTQFLDLNHMQGDDNSSIKLGLYYGDELVSLMTFVKPRFNKHYQYELSRFCSKAGSNVIGGASKLWKYFIDTYKPTSVISYSNISHTKGNLYGLLGFTLQGISEPNYVWRNNNNILTRYQCQKYKLLEQGYEGNSEVDIMYNRGYYRIYDCGNKVWVYNLYT